MTIITSGLVHFVVDKEARCMLLLIIEVLFQFYILSSCK